MPHPTEGRYRLKLTLRGAKRTLGAAIQQERPVELEFCINTRPTSPNFLRRFFYVGSYGDLLLRNATKKSETTLADRDVFEPAKHLTRSSVEILP
jgi:hypothetical protein